MELHGRDRVWAYVVEVRVLLREALSIGGRRFTFELLLAARELERAFRAEGTKSHEFAAAFGRLDKEFARNPWDWAPYDEDTVTVYTDEARAAFYRMAGVLTDDPSREAA